MSPSPSAQRRASVFLDLSSDEGDSLYAAGSGRQPRLASACPPVCSLGWDDPALTLAFYSLDSSLICPSRSRSAPAGGRVVLKLELAQISAHHPGGG